jgi:mRNA-degrading endonuclease RelE of RelBE toxin-antitoxin system
MADKTGVTVQTVKVDIFFQALMEAISALATVEKQKLWEKLNDELFPDEDDSPEDIADVQAARADYEAGDLRKLRGTDHEYRIRIGDYRVRYEIEDEGKLIVLLQCKHRKESYR